MFQKCYILGNHEPLRYSASYRSKFHHLKQWNIQVRPLAFTRLALPCLDRHWHILKKNFRSGVLSLSYPMVPPWLSSWYPPRMLQKAPEWPQNVPKPLENWPFFDHYYTKCHFMKPGWNTEIYRFDLLPSLALPCLASTVINTFPKKTPGVLSLP